jgi:rare lipoprotein A (peptidoglycan hydrolase)
MVNPGTRVRIAWMVAAYVLAAGCAFFSAGKHDESPVATARLEMDMAEMRVPPGLESPAPRARPDVASWYGEWHHGRPTASGEPFDMAAMTAAHRSMALGTCLEVKHLGNGRQVYVRVNDRGPYIPGRSIDLSLGAAQALGMVDSGLARVRIHRVTPERCDPTPTTTH